MATEKQVNYAMSLLAKAGYSTNYMNAQFSKFATMRERSGKVQDWLANMGRQEISQLIDRLIKEVQS